MAGILIDITTLRAALLEQVRLLIGESGVVMLADVISASTRTEHGVWASAVAFVALLIGATTAFAELKDGLDEIFGSTRPSARAGLWARCAPGCFLSASSWCSRFFWSRSR